MKRGSTSVRRLIFIADSSSTTGAGLASLVYNSAGLVAYYFAGDLANEVQITLATATLGTWASGGFVAVDDTNMPGWYEIGIPDAALDAGNEVAIQLRGAANMVPVNIYIELDAVDYQTTAFGANTTAPPTAIAIRTEMDSNSTQLAKLGTPSGDSVSADIAAVSAQVDALTVSVNVLPATGIVADRSAGVTLTPVVGETISQAITLYETDGTTAVDLSGKTLVIVFETMAGVDVATVANANITVSGDDSNTVTFAYPSAVTASERVLRFAIRDAAAPLTMYLQGVCSVTLAPAVDT